MMAAMRAEEHRKAKGLADDDDAFAGNQNQWADKKKSQEQFGCGHICSGVANCSSDLFFVDTMLISRYNSGGIKVGKTLYVPKKNPSCDE